MDWAYYKAVFGRLAVLAGLHAAWCITVLLALRQA